MPSRSSKLIRFVWDIEDDYIACDDFIGTCVVRYVSTQPEAAQEFITQWAIDHCTGRIKMSYPSQIAALYFEERGDAILFVLSFR